VKVIGHHHERVEDPPLALHGLSQTVDQPLAVRVVRDNVLPGIAAGHHVVDRIRVLESQTASHDSIESSRSLRYNNKISNRSDPEKPRHHNPRCFFAPLLLAPLWAQARRGVRGDWRMTQLG
jgi:hypothetical protein